MKFLKMFACFYKKVSIFAQYMLYIDGCRSICKNIDKTKRFHKESHPDKVDGSYFLRKANSRQIHINITVEFHYRPKISFVMLFPENELLLDK
jgi:hypothetical protein